MKYNLDIDSLNDIVSELNGYNDIFEASQKTVTNMVNTALDKQSGNYANAIKTTYEQYEKDLMNVFEKVSTLSDAIDEYGNDLNINYKPHMGKVEMELDTLIQECQNLVSFLESAEQKYKAYDTHEIVRKANLMIDEIDEDLKRETDVKSTLNKKMLKVRRSALVNNMSIYRQCISEINTINFNSELEEFDDVLRDLNDIVDTEEGFSIRFDELNDEELVSDYSISQVNNFKNNKISLELVHNEADQIREKNWHEFVETVTAVLGAIGLGIAVLGFFWSGMPALIAAIGLVAEKVAVATAATTIGYHLKNKEYGELVMDTLSVGVSAFSFALPKIDEAIKGADEAIDRLSKIELADDLELVETAGGVFDFSNLAEMIDENINFLEWGKGILVNMKNAIYWGKVTELCLYYVDSEYNLEKERIEGLRNGEPWPRVTYERFWGEAYQKVNILNKIKGLKI